MGNNLFGTICWNKNFLPLTPNIRLLKDKLVTKIFMAAFQKINSNPALLLNNQPVCRVYAQAFVAKPFSLISARKALTDIKSFSILQLNFNITPLFLGNPTYILVFCDPL